MNDITKKYIKEIRSSNHAGQFIEGYDKCTKDQLLQSLANAELGLELYQKTFSRLEQEIRKLEELGYIDEMVKKESEFYDQDKEYFPFIFAVIEGYPFYYYDFHKTKDGSDYGYARIHQWKGGKYADKIVWWDLETTDWVRIEQDKGHKDCKHKKIKLPPFLRGTKKSTLASEHKDVRMVRFRWMI